VPILSIDDFGLRLRIVDLGTNPQSSISIVNPHSQSPIVNHKIRSHQSPIGNTTCFNIKRLDAFRLLHDIVDTPSAFGLTNVASPCVTPNIPPFTCDAPDEFLFWDGIHPSTATHALIAIEAASVLLN